METIKKYRLFIGAALFLFIVFAILVYCNCLPVLFFTLFAMFSLMTGGWLLYRFAVMNDKVQAILTENERLKIIENEIMQKKAEEQKAKSEKEKHEQYKINTIAEITYGLKREKSPAAYAHQLLTQMSKKFQLVQGIFHMKNGKDTFSPIARYAFYSENGVEDFKLGEGLAGQAAADKELLNLSDIPDDYFTIISGTGSSKPKHIIISPVIHNNESIGVIEIASFREFDKTEEEIIFNAMKKVGEEIAEYNV